jgi:hypothetical protein
MSVEAQWSIAREVPELGDQVRNKATIEEIGISS